MEYASVAWNSVISTKTENLEHIKQKFVSLHQTISFPMSILAMMTHFNFKSSWPLRWEDNTIQINQPTRCNNFSSLLFDVYVQLNMFRASSRRIWAGRPNHDEQHCYHHAPVVKPGAATAVVELLRMGMRTPETCWAVHKRQVTNLRNCCI